MLGASTRNMSVHGTIDQVFYSFVKFICGIATKRLEALMKTSCEQMKDL
jgi:hypothetical protein